MTSSSNKSKTTIYHMFYCQKCGTSCPINTERCPHCKITILKPQKTMCQSACTGELDVFNANRHTLGSPGDFRREQVYEEQLEDHVSDLQDGFKSACSSIHVVEAPTLQQGALGSHQIPQQKNEKFHIKSTSVYKDFAVQTNLSFDLELAVCAKKHCSLSREKTAEVIGLELESLPESCRSNSTEFDCISKECMKGSQLVIHDSKSEQVMSLGSELLDVAMVENSCFCTPAGVSDQSDPALCTESDLLDREDDWSCHQSSFEYHSVRAEDPTLQGSSATMFHPCGLIRKGDHEDNIHTLMQYQDKLQQSSGSHEEESDLRKKCKEKANPSICEDSFLSALGDEGSSDFIPCERCLALCARVTERQSGDAGQDFTVSFMVSRSTSTEPKGTQCDVALNTDPFLLGSKRDQEIQKLPIPTAEKFVNTDVYMKDLDYITEEFKKLRLAQAELKQLKENLASPAWGERSLCCGAAQRALHAELRLLALQHAMCQQHCWRRYRTSPEGSRLLLGKREIPNSLMQVLQNLENDYQEMRRKVLSGVPLDQLRPLSVDCQRIASKGCYIPAEIAKIVLEDRQGSVQSQNSQLTVHGDSCTGRRDTPALQQQDPKERPAEINTEPESNTSEAWYDAEEDLESIKMEAHQKVDDGHLKIPEEDTMGCCDKKETDEDVLLYASELPCNVTEEEVTVWFRKYQVSNVQMAPFRSKQRAAIVTVDCLRSANRAIKDLNGHTIQGYTIKVEHLGTMLSAESVHKGQFSKSHSCQNNKVRSVCITQASKHRVPITKNLMNIKESVTSPETLTHQHRTTTSSLDTIMAKLSERHPEASRQRIVNSLLELQANHQGFLSGLPLKAVVEMTSALLRHPPLAIKERFQKEDANKINGN
ncbi:RNA-binding protein 44-like isoform X3 [Brienomyrus brachyistius]|uniref:RNA-binding protein 44-like isoform X3 n=1 Tax=Brienomyrus brachyistius TaxID=42636 RepID=UPI0020B2D8A8|nr:RNA-binding protein 44-like isoform X3 [Brienomyrus brachyistius]